MTSAKPVPEPTELIQDLRIKALTLDPAEIGVAPAADLPRVWGVLMETGFSEGLATLLVLADGTVSFYFGHGGGVIGGGEHAEVWSAAEALLTLAQQQDDGLTPTATFPLPDVGRVRFYLLTFSGVLTADADEAEFTNDRHPLALLFTAGHDVITQLRLMSKDG